MRAALKKRPPRVRVDGVLCIRGERFLLIGEPKASRTLRPLQASFTPASFSRIAEGMNRRYAFSIIARLVPV